jgi:mRNA interferase RelE/StbE
MKWTIRYLPEAVEDLDALGKPDARKALKVIEERIINGEPDKAGKPLRKELAGCRRIRTGDIRIVYKVIEDQVQILIIAVGPRRNNKVYDEAEKRVPDRNRPLTGVKKKAALKTLAGKRKKL